MSSLEIDRERFNAAHEAFCQYMLEQSGEPFENFDHPFLFEDEIDYKRIAYGQAKGALSLDQWDGWMEHSPHEIIEAVKAACHPSVSKNLLYHRSGMQNSSEAALYKVESEEQIRGLAEQLHSFYRGGSGTPQALGPRFDQLAEYLRKHSLSANWRFLAYMTFLVDVDRYFPIVPSRFDRLLEFYGVNESVSGYASWERYTYLLDLAETLKSMLAHYGDADAVEIQSYMWVVSELIEWDRVREHPIADVPDFDIALAARLNKAKKRERTGLSGERFVYEQEKTRLREAGRPDLAERVKLVALLDDSAGFDVRSFDIDGSELHIEVKTTNSPQDRDTGFWLSENERVQAEEDPCWCLYRVWNINSSPSLENLGNIVRQTGDQWRLNVHAWFVRRGTEP